MKTQCRLFFATILIALSGCSAVDHLAEMNDKHKDNQVVNQGQPPHPAPTLEIPADTISVPEVSREDFHAGIERLHAESQSSNNATQQSISGLGLNVSKIAEKVDASLVKLSADFDTKLTAVANLNVKVSNELNNNMNARAEANVKAIADLRAEFKAEIQAIAQASAQGLANLQAGIGNRTDSIQKTSSAGRDSTSTEFTKDMRDTILGIVAFLGGIIGLLQERSRRRAETLNTRLLDHHLPPKGEKPCDHGIVRRALRSFW